MTGELDAAIDELGIAIRLNPSFPLAYYGLGQAMMGLGRPDEGIAEIDTAERLSPHDPFVWLFDVNRSLACFSKPDYEAALRHAEKAKRRGAQVGFWPDTEAAAALAQLGRHEESTRALGSTRAHEPKLSMLFVRRALPFKRQEPFENFFDGLRKAGLDIPEEPAASD